MAPRAIPFVVAPSSVVPTLGNPSEVACVHDALMASEFARRSIMGPYDMEHRGFSLPENSHGIPLRMVN